MEILFIIIPFVIVVAVVVTVIANIIRVIGKAKDVGQQVFKKIVFPKDREADEDKEKQSQHDVEIEKTKLEIEKLKMEQSIREQEAKRIRCDYCGSLNKAALDKCQSCGAKIKN